MVKLFFILCSLAYAQDEPVIAWSESYKLSWADFKAAPNNKVKAAATTASGISFGFSVSETDAEVISFTAEVFCYFYPEQSWYKPNVADQHVLEHEQLHFDITELHARKFRQGINELKVSNSIKRELGALNKTTNKALAAMQNKYDTESNFSRNFENQANWKTYIAEELEKLSRYKSGN